MKEKLLELLWDLENYKYPDYNKKADEILCLFSVSGRSEQLVCLCPRNETDNCDREEPCKECETCQHLRQKNYH